jgi:hypothetical protein
VPVSVISFFISRNDRMHGDITEISRAMDEREDLGEHYY